MTSLCGATPVTFVRWPALVPFPPPLVLIDAGVGVGSGRNGCPPCRSLPQLLSRLWAAGAHPCSLKVFVPRPCPAAPCPQRRPGPWSHPVALSPVPPGSYPCAVPNWGPKVFFFAPSALVAAPQRQPERQAGWPLPTSCVAATGGRATPSGAGIDTLRMGYISSLTTS